MYKFVVTIFKRITKPHIIYNNYYFDFSLIIGQASNGLIGKGDIKKIY